MGEEVDGGEREGACHDCGNGDGKCTCKGLHVGGIEDGYGDVRLLGGMRSDSLSNGHSVGGNNALRDELFR